MTLLFDQQNESVLDGTLLAEIFFADGTTDLTEDDDGLIWKDVLKEGTWAYRPGAGQKPIPIPLKVVAGEAEDNQIGMSDIIASFEDGAIDHVTVPTSHDDKPHENTGYVRKLKIENRNGINYLRAGIEFTEPDIKDKAIRGTIANTSAGVMFGYVKKDTGKKYSAVLGHVALTNKPWLNGMKPFGVAASEEFSDDEITPLMLASIVWNENKSFSWLRNEISKKLNPVSDVTSTEDSPISPSYYVADISSNRALVSKFDNNGGTEENFVVPFKVQDDSIQIEAKDNWIPASREWVKASEEFMTNFKENFDESNSVEETGEKEDSSEGANSGAEEDSHNDEGGNSQVADKENEGTSGTPSTDSAPEATLSEDKLNEFRAEFEESQANLSEEIKTLRKENHNLKVERRIEELKTDLGEQPGLLKTVREIMLADNGQPALILSEKESEDAEAKEVSLSASDVVERVLDALPKKDGKTLLGEQHSSIEDGEKPASTPDVELSDDPEEVKKRGDAYVKDLGLGEEYQVKDGE